MCLLLRRSVAVGNLIFGTVVSGRPVSAVGILAKSLVLLLHVGLVTALHLLKLTSWLLLLLLLLHKLSVKVIINYSRCITR